MVDLLEACRVRPSSRENAALPAFCPAPKSACDAKWNQGFLQTQGSGVSKCPADTELLKERVICSVEPLGRIVLDVIDFNRKSRRQQRRQLDP
jgi:hypothetical protein